ncbi:Predicted arabinose efflux permease, MFS family [Roseovarius pacificus]|uniref:Predicted arabinose efflux permease, MFS family n=1 Tax=Roseovarius pacificus TaxID=337701 RepID=A0A1M7DC90_9RHOB|nr:MFS transporter [Roseovarius pacificus]GGO56708.1 MFS transporter [Roseovarius pacificus]SHL76819.1 Predicted arabinose efflux permease, MFS family [Roseovarius pacificus]
MSRLTYFILANFLSSVSMGVFLIALPWLIVKTLGGNALIAVSAFAMLVLFLLRQRSGTLVDSAPRGRLFATAMVGMGLLLALLAVAPANTALMLTVFFCGQIYLFFYYVIRSAITREIVPEGQFGRYNGILEIEGQVSTFFAGGAAAFFFAQNTESLSPVLWASAGGMLISSLIVLVKLPTDAPPRDAGENETETPATQAFPLSLMLLAYCGSVPFICVMLLNVIKPIVIVDLLRYSGEVLALTSVFYTIGAIAAGLLGGRGWIGTGQKQVVTLTLFGFFIFCLLPAIAPTPIVLYVSSVVWGFSNGLSRITWQTAAMSQVGNQRIGNFFATVTAGVGVMRIGLLFGYWAISTLWGYEISFGYLALICAIGLVVFASALLRPQTF